ncbi:MAG: response regulator transcription factor, partial [Bacteroidota bacterium]
MPLAKLRTLIVDDEALARQVLKDYVNKTPSVDLVGECGDGISALEFLQRTPVDLLLLDINMPELSGLELLASLPHTPQVILTTAYSQYALESYEYGVVDYLMKPISFARFLKAVNRATGTAANVNTATREVSSPNYLEIKHDGMALQLPLNQLLYVKSFGNYLRLITQEKTYTILETLTNMNERLPNNFQRVHKSYIVNTKRISQLE